MYYIYYMEKKRYTTVPVRVDKKIKKKVEDHIIGQESIGGFYDRAAEEKIERETGGEKTKYDERLNRVK